MALSLKLTDSKEIVKNFQKLFRGYTIEESSQKFIYRVEEEKGKVAYVVDCIFKILRSSKGKIPEEHKNFWYKIFEEGL